MTTTVSMTRDAVLSTAVRNPFTATTDQGGRFEVVGPCDADRVFVRGYNSGNLALVTRTGSVQRRGQVRVRFDFSRDLGDVAGTLAFFDSVHTGGVVPASAFELGGDRG